MTTLTGGKYDIQLEKKKSLYYEKSHLPLSSHSRSCIQSKLSHHALLQVFLFPLGHVSFQSKNPFFFLTQEFHKRRGVVLRDVGSLRRTLTLMSKIKKKKSQDASVSLRIGLFDFCLKDKAGLAQHQPDTRTPQSEMQWPVPRWADWVTVTVCFRA